MNKPLKCYFAGSRDPFEHPYVDVCFARTYREAKKLLWKHGEYVQEECDWRYFDMKLTRMQKFDELAERFAITEQGVVFRDDIRREMGWACEGDSQCSACGLAEFDGMWPLCEDCHQCEDCGHADDCPDREAPSHG